jgi:hypothetical protein
MFWNFPNTYNCAEHYWTLKIMDYMGGAWNTNWEVRYFESESLKKRAHTVYINDP